MRTSPRRVDPRNVESTAIQWKRLHCSAMGCESGRQDSNLRPLVPQTSPYFPPRAEFDLECFRREKVGNTTRPREMESAGIALTSAEVDWAYTPSPLFPIVLVPRTRPHRIEATTAHGIPRWDSVYSNRPSRRLERNTGLEPALQPWEGEGPFCIPACAITASRCLSTPLFERCQVPIDGDRAPITVART